MANIGFSTGCLYKTNRSMPDRIKTFHNVGATAIELSFSTPQELFSFKPELETIEDIKKFKYVSIHAPWKEIRYGSNELTEEIIRKIRYLSESLSSDGIVVHPDTIDSFTPLERSNLPFLLENMSKEKETGTTPEHFEELKRKCDFGFVFDAQHAYEHDSSMRLASRLLLIMRGRLKHVHISGQKRSERHTPIFMSENKEQITKLRLGGIQKISEGIITKDITQTLFYELEFIKNNVK
jgi:hypothetical protein